MSNRPNFVDRAIRDFERREGRKPTKEELSRWVDQPDVQRSARLARAGEAARDQYAIMYNISPPGGKLLLSGLEVYADVVSRGIDYLFPLPSSASRAVVTAPIVDNTKAGRAAREEVAKGTAPGGVVPANAVPFPEAFSPLNKDLFNQLKAAAAKQEVEKGAAGTAGTAAADKSLLPLPKVVVEERLRGEGVNTNLEEYERDSAGSNTGVAKATTSNQAFSVNRRQGQSFNIGRFRAEVSGADSVLPTHSFLVVFAPMPWAIQKFPTAAGNLDSILTMRCDNVVLPSINLLQEQNIRRYGFGPVENVPYGVNVGDFTLQFIVDKNAFVVQFFEEWLNKIVNRDSFGGANMNNVLPGGRRPYEIAYKDTYACSSINVFVYDRSQNNVMEYNIYDAFPTGIQSMNMSWSEENELMKLNITFSFTDVRIKQSPAKNKKEGAGAFGSSVDFQNALVNGPKMTDAELKSFLSSNPLVYAGSLTDLTKETITIGDGARTRGSVTPVQLNTVATSQTTDVPVQKNVSTLNVRINPPA